jgi:macrolide transport system ATP-binding/permease protein
VKERYRDQDGLRFVDAMVQDVRYGWRTMCRNPSFTAMAMLSLALAIGANTAIYSVMDAILFRALPVRNPGELVILHWRAKQAPLVGVDIDGQVGREPGGAWASADFPWPFYDLLHNDHNVFSTLFAYKDAGRLNLLVDGQAESGPVVFVSGNFFSGLGVNPAAGRLIQDSDNLTGAPAVAVLGYAYWRSRFAGDTAAIGKTVAINNMPFTVGGVVAPEFFGVIPGSTPALYIPIVHRPSLGRNSANEHISMFVDSHDYWADIIGRLRSGITMTSAQVEIAGRFRQFALAAAANDTEFANLPSLWLEAGGSGVDSLRRQYSKPLFILMTMVAFILTIACANIANLLLVRATARRRELAVRLSLGASRRRVLRQLLTESVLLALCGGILSLGVGAAGVRFLVWLLAGGREDLHLHVELDWRILAFTMAVAFATGILFGFAPALAATRVDITPALKETRASAPHGRGRRIGLSHLLVVTQVALSLLLVLGAVLFVRTLANLQAVELGFNAENVLTFSLNASQAGYKGVELRTFYAQMEERFRLLPGVRAATVTDWPLVAAGYNTRISLPSAPGTQQGHGLYISVGPTFFETIQLPILLGRPIDSRDVDGTPFAVVVNEVFAQKYFPNQNPIGRHVGLSPAADVTIVGVAKNAPDQLKGEIPPFAYIAYLQYTPHLGNARTGAMFFELRTSGNPLALAGTVRKAVREAAPSIPLANVMTQSQRIANSMTQERAFATLCTAFGMLALMMAGVGLYGTVAYAVSRRTNEIGIRMALGAERRNILWMVLREVLALSTAGLAIGFVCAWSAMPAITFFLFGIKPADPLAIMLASGILITALCVAGYAPAMRASRIDPLTALRHE